MNYLFDITPGPDFRYTWPLLIIGAGLIIASIFFQNYYRKRKKIDIAFKKIFANVSSAMLTFGLLILFFTGVRYQNIPYFAMRLWLALTLVTLLYTIYHFAQKYRSDYKKLYEENVARHKTKKKDEKVYLASKKKK